MNSIHIIRLLRMLAILTIQVTVLNHVHVMGYATPLLIGYMVSRFRRGTSMAGLLLWGFCTGILFDTLSNTMGMATISCTLAAMAQPSILKLFTPNDAPDDFAPTLKTMETGRYVTYLTANFLLLHTAFYALDAFTLADWPTTAAAILTGTAISCLIAIVAELATQGPAGRH